MKKFDKDKYLKKLKFKRAWCKYERYFYIGVPCLIIALLVMCTILNKNAIFEDNKVYLDNAIGAYIDGEYSKTIPGKNDGYVVKNIVCDNDAIGTWDNDKWGLLTTNMTQKSKCNIYFETKKTSVVEAINVAMSTDSSMFATDDPDNNVRYIGADPSNYLYFNCSDYNNQSDSTCEKWRIIGLFNNITKSDGTKENLVKIIRDESIGIFDWDHVNEWSTATLQQYLNSGTYYTTMLKNDITRNTIESVVWNIGGVSSTSLSSSGFYSSERGTDVYSGHTATWTGKVGLKYPSDYGYATAGSSVTNRSTCLSTALYNWDNVSDCYTNDYLYKTDYNQWTLTPYSKDDYHVFFIYSTVGNVFRHNAYYDYSVYPALYLKSNILVKSGNGTRSAPYQLNLE